MWTVFEHPLTLGNNKILVSTTFSYRLAQIKRRQCLNCEHLFELFFLSLASSPSFLLAIVGDKDEDEENNSCKRKRRQRRARLGSEEGKQWGAPGQ